MEFIATFCLGGPFPGKFVRVKAATYKRAHAKMMEAYGKHWAFLYSSEQEAGVDRWRLQEMPFTTPIKETKIP